MVEFHVVTMFFSIWYGRERCALRLEGCGSAINKVISDDMYNRCMYFFAVIIVNGLAASLLAQKERGVEGHVAVKGNCLNI
jgi:hypothetical protein